MQYVDAGSARIPQLGFGTWELTGSTAHDSVQHALDAGYRHLDTAQAYDNEAQVGRALEHSGVKRNDVFLTTKVWTDNFARLKDSTRESLDKLKVDQVDLLLLHWPVFEEISMQETLDSLMQVHSDGLTRNIGISNFTTEQIQQAFDHTDGALAVNQVEYHPFLNQAPVLDKLHQLKMGLTAYSPLARGQVFDQPQLKAIGERHGKTAGQVTLRWLLDQPGVIAIPRSSNPDHIRSNFEVFDFDLSDKERNTITNLQSRDGRTIDPDGLAPDWDT